MFQVFFGFPKFPVKIKKTLVVVGLYPLLEINLSKLKQNIETLQKKCSEWMLKPVAVTKGFCADYKITDLLYGSGIRSFADSNLSNLLKLIDRFGHKAQYQLIRLPMKEEINVIIENQIIPLVSQLEILNLFAQKTKQFHAQSSVILAIETGDGREGFLPEEVLNNIDQIVSLDNIAIIGIGTSLACLSGVLPQIKTLEELSSLRNQLRLFLHNPHLFISVGGTTFFSLWEECSQPPPVDQIRCGEAFLFGSDISRKRNLNWLQQGAFHIEAEIVEIKNKQPDSSDRGFDAFGRPGKMSSEKNYPRKRALVAVGLQDIDDTQLFFEDRNVTIIGATSNYLVLDCEESQHDYRIGDLVRFQAGYGTVLRAFLSPYVQKRYIE